MAESKQARTTRRAKETERRAVSQKYLVRGQRGALLGPLVTECVLPSAGVTLLVRRLDLSAMAAAGVWPGPITQAVRRLIIDGALGQYRDNDRQFLTTAVAIARAAAIVPPGGLADGSLAVEDIRPEQCRPLFVESDPADDQFVLRVVEVARGLTPEQAAESTARAMEEAAADESVLVLQTYDLVALMHHILENAPGARSRFRLADLRAVGGVAAQADDGQAHEPAAAD